MVSVESVVETGHVDLVHDAQLDYYGTKLATASSDRSVKIFEVKHNESGNVCVADLRGHEGPVWQIAWAHPRFGNILASCSYDRKVMLWREESGNRWQRIHEYAEHDSSVNSVCWAPSELGLTLACGSSDGTISLLSYNENSQSWHSKKIANAHHVGVNAVSWAPNMAALQSFDNKFRLASGGCDNLVKVWRLESENNENYANGNSRTAVSTVDPSGEWIEESKLEAHSDWVRDVAWAPSLGVVRWLIASCSQDRRVILWSRDANKASDWTPMTLHTFDDVVWHLSWSISGNMLAVSGGDNNISLWKEGCDAKWKCISDNNNKQQQG